MSRDIDALTSYTLKHLRDRWWTTRWTHWVRSHLRCDAGARLVHVGCGNGEIDVALALATPDLRVVSIDIHPSRAHQTKALAGDVNAPVHAVAGDIRALPFGAPVADAVLCIGVLQHLDDPKAAAHALAGLLRPGGRILVVEPDHEARYWHSGCEEGEQAYRLSREILGGWHRQSTPGAPDRLGVHVVDWLRDAGLEPLSVEPVPVSEARLGAPPPGVWEARARAIDALGNRTGQTEDAQRLAEAIENYRAAADAQGPAFVEMQHALLIATVAQRSR